MSKRGLGLAVRCCTALMAGLFLTGGLASAQTGAPPAVLRAPVETAKFPVSAPQLPPTYTADLTTTAAMGAFNAQWRNLDAKIVEIAAMPGAGPQWKTAYDLQPKAGAADFDDSSWPVIEPKGVLEQRGGGYIFMTWYRTTLTIPTKIGDFDPTGAKAALIVTVDDYGEVWVNGQLPRAMGRPSPATIQGYNMPNRVMLSESVKPGDKFQIAILGINGPISVAPANAVFLREARVEFFKR